MENKDKGDETRKKTKTNVFYQSSYERETPNFCPSVPVGFVEDSKSSILSQDSTNAPNRRTESDFSDHFEMYYSRVKNNSTTQNPGQSEDHYAQEDCKCNIV